MINSLVKYNTNPKNLILHPIESINNLVAYTGIKSKIIGEDYFNKKSYNDSDINKLSK